MHSASLKSRTDSYFRLAGWTIAHGVLRHPQLTASVQQAPRAAPQAKQMLRALSGRKTTAAPGTPVMQGNQRQPSPNPHDQQRQLQ